MAGRPGASHPACPHSPREVLSSTSVVASAPQCPGGLTVDAVANPTSGCAGQAPRRQASLLLCVPHGTPVRARLKMVELPRFDGHLLGRVRTDQVREPTHLLPLADILQREDPEARPPVDPKASGVCQGLPRLVSLGRRGAVDQSNQNDVVGRWTRHGPPGSAERRSSAISFESGYE
jgi:hypothetical protein